MGQSLNERAAEMGRETGASVSRAWRATDSGAASPDGRYAMVDLLFDDGRAERYRVGHASTTALGEVEFDLLDPGSEIPEESPVEGAVLRRMPYSEVCMHMRVAGKAMWVLEIADGCSSAAQLYDEAGRRFSMPITCGEAGLVAGSPR